MNDELPLSRAMLRGCRESLWRKKIADTAGEEITGGQLLMRALVLRRLLRREVLGDDETRVGVLFPPTNGGAIVNASLTLDRRVAVNLNYSASSDVMNACIKAAGIRHVLTSRKVIEKLNPELDAEVVCLEDVRPKLKLTDKLAGVLGAYAMPVGMLESSLGLAEVSLEDLVTIVFTSGSTGVPKGVMLSHRNLMHNVRAIDEVVHLKPTDVILGILPFFHSFGYTVTMWTPLVLNIQAVYHFSPLDARQVGKLAKKHGATILLSTPTFLRSYLKRVPPEDFATLEVVVVGAEKLPMPLSDAFEARYGVRPSEGYGTTELAPLVSVNVPRSRSYSDKVDSREGSIGQPVPHVNARIVHPETREVLGVDEEGMLEISGPNVMMGYLDNPEATAKVLRDGWYETGDIARIDADGFIFITGRQSRFSKIGGEMVPHVRVEEEIQQLLGGDDAEEALAAVTAVPDERKGERLVVVHLPMEQSPQEVCEALGKAGLPNIWIPGHDSFLQVEELPLLGSGKIDLKGLAALALEHFGPSVQTG